MQLPQIVIKAFIVYRKRQAYSDTSSCYLVDLQSCESHMKMPVKQMAQKACKIVRRNFLRSHGEAEKVTICSPESVPIFSTDWLLDKTRQYYIMMAPT